MGKRSEANLKKRFGDPPRFVAKFAEKPLEGELRKLNNKKILESITAILKAVLGRDPTDDELFGRVEISKSLKKS